MTVRPACRTHQTAAAPISSPASHRSAIGPRTGEHAGCAHIGERRRDHVAQYAAIVVDAARSPSTSFPELSPGQVPCTFPPRTPNSSIALP